MTCRSCIASRRGGLGSGRAAVDLIGQEQVAKDWALEEAEAALAVTAALQHFGAHDVGGEQVRSELDAVISQPQHPGEGLGQQGPTQTGRPGQQSVASRQDRNQQGLQGTLLAHEDLANLDLDCLVTVAEMLDPERQVTLLFRHDISERLARRLGGVGILKATNRRSTQMNPMNRPRFRGGLVLFVLEVEGLF